MTRETISEAGLRKKLNEALHSDADCQDVDFGGPIWRLAEPGPNGENWEASTLSFHGRGADSYCEQRAQQILDDVARRFDVAWDE